MRKYEKARYHMIVNLFRRKENNYEIQAAIDTVDGEGTDFLMKLLGEVQDGRGMF